MLSPIFSAVCENLLGIFWAMVNSRFKFFFLFFFFRFSLGFQGFDQQPHVIGQKDSKRIPAPSREPVECVLFDPHLLS